jgi:hypothetical protein
MPSGPTAPPPPGLLGPAQPLHQAAHHLLVGGMAVQRKRHHQVDDHAGGQQPAALLSPAGLLHDLVDQLGWERVRQGPSAIRSVIGGGEGSWVGDADHPVLSTPLTLRQGADTTSKQQTERHWD